MKKAKYPVEPFAIALIMLAVCPEPQPSGAPCGKCRYCKQLEEGAYPELFHLAPVGKSYQIQVGDRINPEPNTARAFTDSFFLTSTSGASRKVGIIHDADRMGDEAQNALLKTLEEPPPETLMILTTGNAAALLPTTRSRCQQLQLLENHVDFTFAGAEDLFAALRRLAQVPAGDVVGAEESALGIIAVAAALRENAERAVEEQWSKKVADGTAIDPALGKRLEKQQESAAAGAYMRSRSAFLGAIHTFAAQLYQLSCGVDRAQLANPEVMGEPFAVDAKRAEVMLREAELLLFTLRFNVGEELALRNFCLQCISR